MRAGFIGFADSGTHIRNVVKDIGEIMNPAEDMGVAQPPSKSSADAHQRNERNPPVYGMAGINEVPEVEGKPEREG